MRGEPTAAEQARGASGTCPSARCDPFTLSSQGDSGGPLFCRGRLQGLVSFSFMLCGDSRFPDVYTRISTYVSWVRDVLQHY